MENLPYSPKTRQQEGRDSEKRAAKKFGARLHPMSGAGSIKDDASDEENIFEFKDANRSHTLQSADLRSLYVRAVRQGKEARYVITFANGITADIRLTMGTPGV